MLIIQVGIPGPDRGGTERSTAISTAGGSGFVVVPSQSGRNRSDARDSPFERVIDANDAPVGSIVAGLATGFGIAYSHSPGRLYPRWFALVGLT